MGITHLSGLEVAGVPTMGIGGAPFFNGNWWFVDPNSGSDGNVGTSDSPFATIYQAYNSAVANNNDVIVVVGSGDTMNTMRMSVALAQAIVPSATTGTITWAKNATHLIGMTAPVGMNARARFAPPTTTYTAATFGNSGNMFNVTATGCYFANFSVFNGFTTGAAGQVAWIENGGRNYYEGVSFQGMNDTASANSATSNSLAISGAGENKFVDCFFGDDTTARTAANSTVVFTGGSPRNQFVNCKWLAYLTGSGSGAFHVTSAAGGIDREAIFERCKFIVAVKSGSATTMAQVFNLTAPGGMFILDPTCMSAGATAWETSSSGFLYNTGAVPTFATSGKAVAS